MINVFVTELTPRIEYSFKLIFETILSSQVQFTSDAVTFEETKGVKINYSSSPEIGGLYFKPQGLLQESHLQYQNPKVLEWEGTKIICEVNDSTFPFDPFAAAFYLVTRYEEYLPGKRDRHQRFMPRNSIAGSNLFLEKPVVNIWALKLADRIEQEYPGFNFQRPTFKYLPTIDIDNAWAFRNKGFVRIILSMAKDIINGRWRLLRKRFLVVFRFSRDPYDNYDFMLSTFKTYNFRPVYFFLLNKSGKHDRSLSHRNLFYRNLILMLAKTGKVGIHPSYASNKREPLLIKEIGRLKSITGKNIKRSRQHFLKLSMPKTYRRLIQEGVKSDYSMGYPSRPGFRASITTPYFFFDVVDNKATKLKIYPFQVMDVTLLHYRNLRAGDALNKIKNLMNETAKVGGTFVSLWHNESMSDEEQWKGWRNVYTEMTQMAAQLRDGNKDRIVT